MDKKYFHSVILKDEMCIGCTRCLKVCPTEAIRVRDGKARIIDEKCIDCGECIRICPNHAKTAITDSIDIIKKFKYNIAIPSLVLYGQFSANIGINEMLTAVKRIGFDEVFEATRGASIISSVLHDRVLKEGKIHKPLINSACPAIVRLIQVRFPDLLPNLVDIETPVEVAARIAKQEAAERTSLPIEEIGAIFITPCPARVTSMINPVGIKKSYLDGAVSMKAIYGEIVRNLSKGPVEDLVKSTREGLLWPIIGGQSKAIGINNYIAVDGINEVIKVLEEIEMGRLEDLEFLEAMACIKGCVGGPLAIENSFIARKRIKDLAAKLPSTSYTDEERQCFIDMYEDGFIRLTEEVEPMSIMKLDKDISKSMQKMEMIKEIVKNLPGLDCGVCGAPTCRAFAEDIVKSENKNSVCLVKTMEIIRNKNKSKI